MRKFTSFALKCSRKKRGENNPHARFVELHYASSNLSLQEMRLIDLLNYKEHHLCKAQPIGRQVCFDLVPTQRKEAHGVEIKATLKICREVQKGKRKGQAALPPTDVFMGDERKVIWFDPSGVSEDVKRPLVFGRSRRTRDGLMKL